MKTILVTGAAGFIGAAVVSRLLKTSDSKVIGIDNINDYYDVSLKYARLNELKNDRFEFTELDFCDFDALTKLWADTKPDIVIHLGAQAGVRYGLKNPLAYLKSNLIGHFNMLEVCRNAEKPVEHFLYASSSSVYGSNSKVPFEETDNVSQPQSIYAATKGSDELITHAWSNQFKMPATGLRFFTVYGPWGRPDMSPMIFASALLNDKPIPLFNGGDLMRDFTYIDDIVEAIVRLIPHIPSANGGLTPHKIYNLGNQNPIRMTEFVKAMADAFGVEPRVENLPWPPTEVYRTYADTSRLKNDIGWAPSTPLKDGLAKFAEWYKPRHGTIIV